MNAEPLYVYGLLAGPACDLPGAPQGVGGAAVRCLAAPPFAALISTGVPAQIARTRRNLLAHTNVLEQAMAQGTVLPLRFGTVAPHVAALLGCIDANVAMFKNALSAIAGRVELGLKASWQRDQVYDEIVDRDPALRHLRDRLRARPGGETYYERIELGRRVEVALAELRASEAAALLADLLPLAERDVALRLHDDSMILNHAFLVPRAAEAEFDRAVEALAARHAARLEFRYVGPVPAFNFVTLQAAWAGMSGMAEPVQ